VKVFSKYISNDNLRTKMLRKNIIVSVFLQGASMAISLVLLPLSLKFVTVEQYGVWLTINSILMWSANLDLGLGSGLKNRLGVALAEKNNEKAREYVSTAYAVMIVIMGTLSLAYFIISGYVNWVEIFKLNSKYGQLIQKTIGIVVYLFFARFILQLVNVILDAMQKLYLAKIYNALSQFIILLSILLFSYVTKGDILKLGIIFSSAPLLIFLIASIWLFSKYSYLTPSIRHFKLSLVRDLYSLGLKFFFIQISMILLFQTTNILIIRFFGPTEVVQYSVAYNLFSMITIAFSTISAPYWAAYTNAWTLGDIGWIKDTNKKLMKIWIFIVSFAFLVLVFSERIYFLWLRRDLHIPFSLSLAVYIYMCIFSFTGIYNMFINGIGKVQLQIISLGISTILFFPILFLFIKVFGWGLISFPIALMVISNYSLIIAPMQYRALINGTAKGIMNK
jgi:O-antigen/teichoic acid export membrane protein